MISASHGTRMGENGMGLKLSVTRVPAPAAMRLRPVEGCGVVVEREERFVDAGLLPCGA